MPKFTTGQSILYWCRYAPGGCTRGIRSDILACTIITPLAIVITYVCLFSAEYYSQKKFVNVPAARWTSLSLLVMIIIMLLGYYVWTYSVVRMHARLWYNWWQRTCDVRYIPPSVVQVPQEIDTGQNAATVNLLQDIETGQDILGAANIFSRSVLQKQSEVDNKNSPEMQSCSETTQTDESILDGSEYVIVTQELDLNQNIG